MAAREEREEEREKGEVQRHEYWQTMYGLPVDQNNKKK